MGAKMLNRRSFFAGTAALLAAPAIIRTPGLLMPVKKIPSPWMSYGTGSGLVDLGDTPSFPHFTILNRGKDPLYFHTSWGLMVLEPGAKHLRLVELV